MLTSFATVLCNYLKPAPAQAAQRSAKKLFDKLTAKLPTYLLAINQASPFGRQQQQHGQQAERAGPKAGVRALSHGLPQI